MNDVEIYWNGKAYDFDGNLKLPFEILHDAWLQAHTQGLVVTRVKGTDNGHAPRPFVPAPVTKDAEKRYAKYLRIGDNRATGAKSLEPVTINVKK